MKALIDTNITKEIDGKQCNPVVGLSDVEFDVHPDFVFYDFNESAEDWSYWYRAVTSGEFVYSAPQVEVTEEEQASDPVDGEV